MLRKLQERKDEEGFTLIELLVVVIIIGILAAIAIPTFLAQRERAWHSAAESDLRNAAVAQESYFTEASSYAGDPDDLDAEGFNQGSDITFVVDTASADGYCMVANHTSDTDTQFYFDSANGQPEEGVSGDCTDY